MITERIPEALRTYLSTLPAEERPTLQVQLGELPLEPDDIIAIRVSAIPRSMAFFGGTGKLEDPLITFSVRSTSYQTGLTDATKLKDIFNGQRLVNLDMMPTGKVIYLGRDESHRHVFRLNIRTIIKE